MDTCRRGRVPEGMRALAEASRQNSALKMPDYAAADKVVVLPRLAGVCQGQIRGARPEVSDLASDAETVPDPHIQAEPGLKNTRGQGIAGIRPAIDESTVLTEVAEAAAKAYPRGNGGRGKQIQTS